MAMKMATVDKAEELLEKLRAASWNPAVQGKFDYKYSYFGTYMLLSVLCVMNYTIFVILSDLNVLFLRLYAFVYFTDLEDVRSFCKQQGAAEADNLTHWDISFWSERLRESKYDINEVGNSS